MDKIKILVVDDESRMRKLVHDFLAREGYEVLEAGDGEEALDIFYQQKDIALLVLDIMMPRINGLEVCREIRQTSKVPIIMLTAKGDERDELNGFDIGADEYISKPFSPKILVARVNALLRRANKLGKEAVISEAGGIVMDKTAHTVAIDGRNIELSVKEFELLDYFMNNQGIALTRERILDSVWSYDYFGDARTIDTHVKKLRSKMGAKGDYIKTVWGVLKFTGNEILFEGKPFAGDVIYTGALDELFNCKFGRLPYRSLDFHFEHYDEESYQGHSVVNYTVSEDYTRITEFKFLTGQKNTDGTTIVKEYPFAYTGAAGEIPYYAILNEKNQALYEKYRALTAGLPKFHLLGRLAEYKYYNIDAMTKKAMELADAIMNQ